jgi:putative phage-type endonuclease
MVTSEVVSRDALLDKLLKRNLPYGEIVSLMNTCLTSIQVTEDDIKNRQQKVLQYRQQLQMLLDLPKMLQRSPEWYEARKGLITASEFAQALGKAKFGTQKQYFQRKCGYEVDKGLSSTLPPLKWGIMFEPVACELYALKSGQVVHDFGLLRHPTIHFFGASPDGITDDGIMLEIKCPMQRKITGEIPLQYQYQIQGQLSVCNLEECDYLECSFQEDLKEDWVDIESEKGIIIETSRETADGVEFDYVYSPIWNKNTSIAEVEDWERCNQNETAVMRYWSLQIYSVIRVYRDDKFLKEAFNSLQEVWDRINIYKEDKNAYSNHMSSSRKVTHQTQSQTTTTDYMFLDDDES